MSSCVIFRRNKRPTFDGDWRDHAQNAWNYYETQLGRKGIRLRSPSRLMTSFRNAEGTLGRGEDRFPYFNMQGSKVGGYLIGGCNGSASSVLAREESGWWNRNIGTHEVGHHANNHSLCSTINGGHPNEFIGIAPHWPYWSGRGDVRVFNYTYLDEEHGDYICITFVDEASNERAFIDEEPLKEIARGLLIKHRNGNSK